MSTEAIIMMIAAIVVVWGGLGFAVAHLLRHPEGSIQLLDDHGRPL
jgi:hypothetical protein